MFEFLWGMLNWQQAFYRLECFVTQIKKPYKYFHQSNQDYIDYHTNKTEDLTKTDASKSTLYFILVNNKEKSLTVSYSEC